MPFFSVSNEQLGVSNEQLWIFPNFLVMLNLFQHLNIREISS